MGQRVATFLSGDLETLGPSAVRKVFDRQALDVLTSQRQKAMSSREKVDKGETPLALITSLLPAVNSDLQHYTLRFPPGFPSSVPLNSNLFSPCSPRTPPIPPAHIVKSGPLIPLIGTDASASPEGGRARLCFSNQGTQPATFFLKFIWCAKI